LVLTTGTKGGWMPGPVVYTQAGNSAYALNYNGFMTYLTNGAFQALRQSAQNKSSGISLTQENPATFLQSLNTKQQQQLGLQTLGTTSVGQNQGSNPTLSQLANALSQMGSPTQGGVGGSGSTGVSGSTLLLIGIAAIAVIGIALAVSRK
jgi:hypothetical protein